MRATFLAAATMLVGCGASSPAPVPEPRRVAIDDSRLRALATHTARGLACRSLNGRYMPVREESSRVVIGRWMIDHCDSGDAAQPFAFTLSLHGRGWRHVRLNASGVEVDDYVRFDGSVSATEIVDVAPDDGRNLSVLFTPRDASSSFQLARTPDYRTTTLATSTLDVLGLVDGGVRDRATTMGAAILLARGTEARSVAFDTCSGQISTSDTYAPTAPLPGLTVDADRVRLERASGLDIAGPFLPRDQPLRFDIHVESGGRVAATVMCAADAASVAAEWIDRERAPAGTPGGVLLPGVRYAPIDRADSCPLVLVTRAVDGPATLQFRVSVGRSDTRCH